MSMTRVFQLGFQAAQCRRRTPQVAIALFTEQLDAVAPGRGFAFTEVDVSSAAAHGAGQEVVGDHDLEDVGGDAGGVGDFGQL